MNSKRIGAATLRWGGGGLDELAADSSLIVVYSSGHYVAPSLDVVTSVRGSQSHALLTVSTVLPGWEHGKEFLAISFDFVEIEYMLSGE